MGSSKPKYAHEIIAKKEAEDAEAAHRVDALFKRPNTSTAPSDAEVEAERDRLLDEDEHEIHVALNDAVQAGTYEPLHDKRESFGRLALHRRQSIAAFKQSLKPHKSDLGGYTLGAFDAFVEEVKRETIDREAEAEIERQAALDDRPMIPANGDQLALLQASLEALRRLNERSTIPTIYMRGGAPVMVTPGGAVTPIGLGELGFLLARSARYFRKTPEGGIVPADPTTHLLRNLHASLQFSEGFPELNAVWRLPTMTTSGHVIHDGYDAETGFLVVSDLEVSIGGNKEDALAAVEYIDEHIFGTGARSGFPFESEADRANALGMFLTVALRSMVGGLVPIFVVTATGQSNGKSMLAKIPQVVVAGTSESNALPSDDLVLERDHLVPAFNEAKPALVFDNVTGVLDSPMLAKVATDDEFTFRKYREQFYIRGKNNLIVIITGNNLRFGTDLRRRTSQIILNAKCVNPDGRTGFRHPDLMEWVREHRAELLSALMTIARAWYAAGQPEATVPTLGSYGEWSRVVGGMLEYAGVRGFLRNLNYNREADQQGVEAEALLRYLADAYADRPFTSRNVCDVHRRVVTDSLGSFFKPSHLANDATVTKRFGEVLSEIKGRRFGTDADALWIEHAMDDRGQRLKDARNTALWVLHRETLED